jgi:hypothetical protein
VGTICLSLADTLCGTEQVTIVKPTHINQDTPSRHSRRALPAHGTGRIQGGNWKVQGFRGSGHDHDEVECQMSIAEFMAEQVPQEDGYEG